MRRFSVYKRGPRFYVQFRNRQLKRYATGKWGVVSLAGNTTDLTSVVSRILGAA